MEIASSQKPPTFIQAVFLNYCRMTLIFFHFYFMLLEYDSDMARVLDKQKAISLRLAGMSYTHIKKELGLSKSTLSNWLADYPLSSERIKELRDSTPERVEKIRNTKARKKQERIDAVYKKVAVEIGSLSKRELFLSGILLYWAEGTKRQSGVVAFTNTDPDMVILFISWLNLFEVKKEKLKIRLQLYADMDREAEVNFWSKKINLSKENFEISMKKSLMLSLIHI